MSSDSQSPTSPVLNLSERRVLGVLVEKAKTTPDIYPLSVNALMTGCNQKSNRDPILELSEDDVDETLIELQKKGLVIKITGGRVVRWRHSLYETWHVNKVELAILGELLLRGPQTEGELRGRASRMEPIDDLDALRAVLRPMAERKLVVYLTPEGRRGTVLTHGMHAPDELEGLRNRHKSEAVEFVTAPSVAAPPRVAEPANSTALASLEGRVNDAHNEIAALRGELSNLQNQIAALTEQVRGLNDALGG
jgi:uncharacterized protein YceH (UPF0502 family)